MGDRDFVILAVVAVGLTALDWVLFMAVCVLGRRAGSRRNAWAGIRTPSTMASDEAWRAGHQAAMRHVILNGIAIIPVSIVLLIFVGDKPLPIFIAQVVLFLVSLAWILVATREAGRAARSVQE